MVSNKLNTLKRDDNFECVFSNKMEWKSDCGFRLELDLNKECRYRYAVQEFVPSDE